MATCSECGEDVPATATLTCDDCGEDYCRDHYHGHDCSPPQETDGHGAEVSESPTDGQTSTEHSPAVVGYLLAGILGLVGLRYFLGNVDLVLYGSEGIDAIQALVSLAVSGAFFSFATFVLVGSYIIDQR